MRNSRFGGIQATADSTPVACSVRPADAATPRWHGERRSSRTPRSAAFATLCGVLTLLWMGVPEVAEAVEPGALATAPVRSAPPAAPLPAGLDAALDDKGWPHAEPGLTAAASPTRDLRRSATRSVPTRSLEDLLLVRTRAPQDRVPSTDETIAAAVAEGSQPDLEHPDPFRKRSTDLFRTEREVEIGNQEMLLRLRLRAKSRETMSVELRF